MIHGKYINQGEELTDVLKVRQLSLCDAMENIRPEADDMDPMAVNILVDLPLETLAGIDLEKYGQLIGDASELEEDDAELCDGAEDVADEEACADAELCACAEGAGEASTGDIAGACANSAPGKVKSAAGGKKVLYMGCGRILCDVDRFRFYIDQVAVLPELRKQGFGEFALRMLVDKANICGAQKVWLKLPETWASKEAEAQAMKFFTGMHFKPEAYDEKEAGLADEQGSMGKVAGACTTGTAATGAGFESHWMAADIADFHSCCH